MNLKIIFMGRKKYAAECLEWTVKQGNEVLAVVTDSHFPNSPTMKKAQELNIPVVSLEEAEALVSKEEIDLVVSYLFWQKIKEPLISMPKIGCINFHPAILPDWRGTAGYNIAILNQLEQWGATAHYVDENIDTGDIIKIYRFNFDHRIETAFSLERKTQEIQCQLYKSVILDCMQGSLVKATKQHIAEGVYIPRQKMEEMKRINIENDDIDLKIRAFWFPPYDGAFVEINGKRYTLVNKEILKSLADSTATSLVT